MTTKTSKQNLIMLKNALLIKNLHNIDKKILGQNIKNYRLFNNLTQLELSKKVGLTISAINKIENGINYPKKENLLKICKILNVHLYQLCKNC